MATSTMQFKQEINGAVIKSDKQAVNVSRNLSMQTAHDNKKHASLVVIDSKTTPEMKGIASEIKQDKKAYNVNRHNNVNTTGAARITKQKLKKVRTLSPSHRAVQTFA